MLLNVSDFSGEPLQQQIVRQIRALILSGDLSAGVALPSIRSFAKTHRVSVITVQRAYEKLVHEGLIVSRRGKGFFVPELSQRGKSEIARENVRQKLALAIRDAKAEGLPGKEILIVVHEILGQDENDITGEEI